MYLRAHVTLAITAVTLCACARPPGTFRLVSAPHSTLLIPPGVKDASVARASLPAPTTRTKAVCDPSPSGLRIDKKSLVVSREALTAVTPDELNVWSASLEKNGCIATGAAIPLRASVIDALPLDFSARRQLRGDALAIRGSIDLTSVNSLRVVSPVLRPGALPASAKAPDPSSVSAGQNGSINIEIKGNPDMVGYEVAWYDIRRREDGPGFQIVPRSAEVHIAGQTEPEREPRVNRFSFESRARWFRYFVTTRLAGNDYDIVLLSAPTASELETRTEKFRKDASIYLQSADKTSYAAMTQEIGVNPYLRVKVNGLETDLPFGASVRQAIEESTGRGNAAKALPHLSVLKLHGGKLSPVEWDRNAEDILSLTLEGGEEITW